jgi:hypothetical protein
MKKYFIVSLFLATSLTVNAEDYSYLDTPIEDNNEGLDIELFIADELSDETFITSIEDHALQQAIIESGINQKEAYERMKAEFEYKF